jgi:hypothetical protein
MYYISKLEVKNERYDNKSNQFKPCNAYLYEPCGSCHIYSVDGRKSLRTVIQSERDTMSRVNNFYHFAVRKGSPSAKVLFIYNPRRYDVDEYIK